MIRRSETTAPPFCASPVWSMPRTCRPAITAATASTWATVTTPVPPIPAIRSATSWRVSFCCVPFCWPVAGGLGSCAASSGSAWRRVVVPGVTSRNAGQSPCTQEKSRLHEDWSMRVLRPNSVSTGCTDRQFDFAPQSPQPSQTRSLIMTRVAGVGSVPRLRLRRFSAAHAWSWMSTVTPGTAASTRCASSSLPRSHTWTPAGNQTSRWRLGSSAVTMMRALPPPQAAG